MKRWTLVLVAAACGAALSQSAPMKAGLWEVKTIRQVMDGRDMSAQMAAAQARREQQMANMSPEQRAQMEAVMKNMGAGTPRQAAQGVTRVCVSAAMASRSTPMVDRDGQCAPAKVTRDGNKSTFEFKCTSNGRSSVGSGVSTVSGDTVSTRVDMTVTDARGVHSIQSETQMTFRGADCQGIRPADQVGQDARAPKG